MKLACKLDRFLVLTGLCLTLHASGQSSGPWDFGHFHLCKMLHIEPFQVSANPSDADNHSSS